jgi:hypothetical protein
MGLLSPWEALLAPFQQHTTAAPAEYTVLAQVWATIELTLILHNSKLRDKYLDGCRYPWRTIRPDSAWGKTRLHRLAAMQ